jgi:hypothetical protein
VSDAYYCKECTLQEKDVSAVQAPGSVASQQLGCGGLAGLQDRQDWASAACGCADTLCSLGLTCMCCRLQTLLLHMLCYFHGD